MTRRVVLVGLLALALAVTPRPGHAHAGLLEADPAPGSTVAGSPRAIRLTFTEPLAPGSTFVVYAAAFQAVPGIAPMIEGASLRASPAAPLLPGAYTVQWKAVSDDGGITQGSYQFRVVPSAGVPMVWWLAGAAALALVGAALWWRARGRRWDLRRNRV